MASFVFPPDPAVDDMVTGSRGEIYLWDGEKWTWAPARSIEVKPGGDDTDIQFNDDGKFGGSDRFRIELQKDSSDTMGRTDLYIQSRYTQGYGWTPQPALIHLRGTSMMNYPSTPYGYAGIVFENWAVNDYNQGPLEQALIRCVNVLYGGAGNSTLDFFVQNSNQWRQMLSLGGSYGDATIDTSSGTFRLLGNWNDIYGQTRMTRQGYEIDDGNDLYTLAVRTPYPTRPPDFNQPYNSLAGNAVVTFDADGSLCFGKYPNVNSGPPSYVWTFYPWWIQSASTAYQQIVPLPIVFQPLGGNILIGTDVDGNGRLQVAGDINIIDPGGANGYAFRINGVPIGGGGGSAAGDDGQVQINDNGAFGASYHLALGYWSWDSNKEWPFLSIRPEEGHEYEAQVSSNGISFLSYDSQEGAVRTNNGELIIEARNFISMEPSVWINGPLQVVNTVGINVSPNSARKLQIASSAEDHVALSGTPTQANIRIVPTYGFGRALIIKMDGSTLYFQRTASGSANYWGAADSSLFYIDMATGNVFFTGTVHAANIP